eukprot:3806019-Pleurochrysis_carterae.AAC.1
MATGLWVLPPYCLPRHRRDVSVFESGKRRLACNGAALESQRARRAPASWRGGLHRHRGAAEEGQQPDGHGEAVASARLSRERSGLEAATTYVFDFFGNVRCYSPSDENEDGAMKLPIV